MYLYGNNTFEQGNVRGFLQGGVVLFFVFCLEPKQGTSPKFAHLYSIVQKVCL